METSKRNKPATLIIVSVAVIALLIVFYFVLLTVFPNLFETLPTGEVQPVQDWIFARNYSKAGTTDTVPSLSILLSFKFSI